MTTALVLATVAGALAMLDAFARRSLYPAPAVAVGAPPPGVAEVRLTAGGAAPMAWSGGGEAAETAPLVLFFHGNGENLETLRRAGTVELLGRLDAAFLALEYPGYGRSPGTPGQASLTAAAEAALAWAGDHHPQRPVVACGWSLGAAVAVELAGRRPGGVAGLVALSPWSDLHDLARRFFPGPLVRLALRDRWASRQTAPRIAVPALVVHGADDPIIPAAHGRELAAALGGPVELAVVPGAGHNDLLSHPEVWRALARFVAARRRIQPAGAGETVE